MCFGVVSRLSKEKKIEDIIKIVENIKEKISLEIIGDGPDKNKLKDLTKKLNISNKVKFVGSVNPKKIHSVMQRFNYFINNSDFEGFPNSVVEALSSGIPVLASQSHGGINDIIINKNFGIIFNNNLELKNILKKITQKKIEFKIEKKKLIKHLNNFSEKKNTSNYIDLFDKI